ncbi:MAG: molybdopterin-binding protein [Paracoccaceae bacterium]
MTRHTAAMLVIGDEILSGRTRDANMHHLAGQLTEKGIDLQEVRVISDDRTAIITAVNALRTAYDFVFTSGGIGPTHDDITADCVAAAFEAHIDVRADAHALLAAHYAAQNKEFNTARQRMARIPDGAILIENPVSIAPGFQMENVYVMAGVPSVFQAMLASVLAQIADGAQLISRSIQIHMGEGDLAAPLGQIALDHPQVSIGSYPFQLNGQHGANIVLRSAQIAALDLACTAVAQAFAAHISSGE